MVSSRKKLEKMLRLIAIIENRHAIDMGDCLKLTRCGLVSGVKFSIFFPVLKAYLRFSAIPAPDSRLPLLVLKNLAYASFDVMLTPCLLDSLYKMRTKAPWVLTQ
jgi:hypothetical protein